mmetsp:Transcript_8392/g.16472  ORF Transcript_8392/g.16472 Transcript_8392/m.16472 type:complete len:154 (+) Transcript_8392:652-1113(+)
MIVHDENNANHNKTRLRSHPCFLKLYGNCLVCSYGSSSNGNDDSVSAADKDVRNRRSSSSGRRNNVKVIPVRNILHVIRVPGRATMGRDIMKLVVRSNKSANPTTIWFQALRGGEQQVDERTTASGIGSATSASGALFYLRWSQAIKSARERG